MPGLKFSPGAIIGQIKQLLADRYHSGFPILKELLQNADDAEAHRFVADFRDSGFANAVNPLLRAPGVLILNDGGFSETDMKGIGTFGDSTKSEDSAQIGKFGIGQKAVFHLCDAFVVAARGYSDDVPQDAVINPFVDISATAERWEDLDSRDRLCLSKALEAVMGSGGESPGTAKAGAASRERCLGIWIPFRTRDLRPAKDGGFTTTNPDLAEVVRDWKRPSNLCGVLTLLKHLREITIRRNGKDLVALRVRGSASRLSLLTKGATIGVGATSERNVRSVDGVIHNVTADRTTRYVVREALSLNEPLCKLQASEYWPRVYTALRAGPQPEKGEPHGAVSLWCDSPSRMSAISELSVSWAVFLPLADKQDCTIPVSTPSIGPTDDAIRVHLLLHGYFFLDSGRQRIDGVDGSRGLAPPSDEPGVRRTWNAELANSVVLPLLPRVFMDAREAKVLTRKGLRQALASLAASSWFRVRRRAICRKHALACVLSVSGSRLAKPQWQTLPAGSKMRPLPDFVSRQSRDLEKLLPEVRKVADEYDLVLCADVAAALTATDMSWSADELSDLFAVVPDDLFNRPASVTNLEAFFRLLKSTAAVLPESVKERIVASLREALLGSAALAGSGHIASLLQHLSGANIRVLPRHPGRSVLRILARSRSTALIVPREFLPGGSRHVAAGDLKALLEALEPAALGPDSDLADAAWRTAFELIKWYGDASAIIADSAVASLRLLRGRIVVPKGRPGPSDDAALLSIEQIQRLVGRGTLFAGSPDAYTVLPLLAAALPDVSPVVLPQQIAGFLDELSIPELTPLQVDKRSLCSAVREAGAYGPDAARSQLIKHLLRMPGAEDRHFRHALQCLCTRIQCAHSTGCEALSSRWRARQA